MSQVLFEFTKIGQIVRVSAIDEETGTEVVIQGPTKAGIPGLQRIALKKLTFMLKKMAKEKKGT